MIDTLRSFVHLGSILVGCLILTILIIGILKPRLLRFFMHEFSERRYLGILSVFTVLLCGTIFIATEQPNEMALESHSQKQIVQAAQHIDNASTQPNTTVINEVTTTEKISFAKQSVNDASLPIGQTKITQVGKDGEKKFTYNVTTVDGKETNRVLKTEAVTTEPTNEITSIGTKQVSQNTTQTPPKNTPQASATKPNSSNANECKSSIRKLRLCLPSL